MRVLRNAWVQVCNLQVTCAICSLSVHPNTTESKKDYVGFCCPVIPNPLLQSGRKLGRRC